MVPLRGNYKSFAAGEHHDYSLFIFHSSFFSISLRPPPEGERTITKNGAACSGSPADCRQTPKRKSLAEFFASQREKSFKSVFSGDMRLGKNTSQPASVRAASSQAPSSPLSTKPFGFVDSLRGCLFRQPRGGVMALLRPVVPLRPRGPRRCRRGSPARCCRDWRSRRSRRSRRQRCPRAARCSGACPPRSRSNRRAGPSPRRSRSG